MQSLKNIFINQPRKKLIFIALLCLALTQFQSLLGATSQGIRRISLGTNSVEADASSFHLYFSEDADIAVFQSYAHNWNVNDPLPALQDVFIRDDTNDVTKQITRGNDDSFDPSVSLDGRYVAFTSYASDLVPNDNNTTSIWIRDGLDVFLYDRQSGDLDRVSLTHTGGEIKGNSIGGISPDGQFIVFLSNGQNIISGETNGPFDPAIYLRDWRTGDIERITFGIESATAFPDGALGGISMSEDNRYVVFEAEATNLVTNDTNGVLDVFMLDRQTGITKRISQSTTGGNGNGLSAKARVSLNGEVIVFHSEASNLVPNDTNGVMDVFVYTIATGDIERISVNSSGTQGNGLSREPSVCGNGRFVTFTSEATNLHTGDNNNQRDIFLRDLWLDETYLITKNDSGTIGNGKAHRSFISPDCLVAGFASDATNLVTPDQNGSRDLFRTDLLFSQIESPTVSIVGEKVEGAQISLSVQIPNSGSENGTASMSLSVPNDLNVDTGSLTNGATFSNGTISWNGTVNANNAQTIAFMATVASGSNDFAVIPLTLELTGDGQMSNSTIYIAVNGQSTYLPIVSND